MERPRNTAITQGSGSAWLTQDKPPTAPPDRTPQEEQSTCHGISAHNALPESDPNKTSDKPELRTVCKVTGPWSSAQWHEHKGSLKHDFPVKGGWTHVKTKDRAYSGVSFRCTGHYSDNWPNETKPVD